MQVKKPTSPDWRTVLDDLFGAGITRIAIGQAMGLQLCDRLIKAYRVDGTQPAYWRGDGLLTLWCTTMDKTRDQVPMAEVIRGHRVGRGVVQSGPRLQSLPQWPPAAPAAVSPIKRRKKVRELA